MTTIINNHVTCQKCCEPVPAPLTADERERMRFPIIPNEDFDKPCSVVRPWMNHLPFKMQTVMLVALRGFDGVGKHDRSKPLIKALRMTLLQNANPNSGFMEHMNLSLEQVFSFLEEESHSYPMHWLMHFAHAAEIIGYEHPQYGVRVWWSHVYHMVCDVLHVTAESKTQMWERLADSV